MRGATRRRSRIERSNEAGAGRTSNVKIGVEVEIGPQHLMGRCDTLTCELGKRESVGAAASRWLAALALPWFAAAANNALTRAAALANGVAQHGLVAI